MKKLPLSYLNFHIFQVPEIPAPPTMGTDLNFLKPGSREVLHRPVYVHEYMPPMFPELENEPDEHPQGVNGDLVRYC